VDQGFVGVHRAQPTRPIEQSHPAITELHSSVGRAAFATTALTDDFTRALPLGNGAGNPSAELAELHLLEPDCFKTMPVEVHMRDRWSAGSASLC